VIRQKNPEDILKKFDPVPRAQLQPKFNYFYLPYSKELHIDKYMQFEEDRNEGRFLELPKSKLKSKSLEVRPSLEDV